MKYTTERFVRVYNDEHGFYWEIRPDADALGCVEVWYCDNQRAEDKPRSLLTADPKAARLIALAMREVAVAIELESGSDSPGASHGEG